MTMKTLRHANSRRKSLHVPNIIDNFNDIVEKSYTGHSDDVCCCSFSTDFELLVTGSDDCTLRVWNLADGNSIHVLRGHKQQIRCVSFSHNNKVIASAGNEKFILIWNIEFGKLTHRLKYHTSSISCLAFSNSNLYLCSGSWDYTAALWDLQKGILLNVLRDHSSVVQCCLFTEGILATGSWDYSIILYEIEETEKEYKFDDKLSMIEYENDGKNFSQNNDVTRKRKKLKQHHSNIKCLSFSTTGLLASASWDCTVCVWNISTCLCVFVLRAHEGFVHTCAFSPNGQILASAADDQTVRIWSMENGLLMKTLDSYADEIHQLSFTKSGTLLSSGPKTISLCFY